MKWIILIGDETLTLDLIKSIKHFGSVKSYDVSEDRYCVDYESDHIFYDYFEDMIDQYDESERKIIPFDNPQFVMMVYRTGVRVKEIVQQDNFLRGIYVDNDSGLIVPIEKFIKIGMPMES